MASSGGDEHRDEPAGAPDEAAASDNEAGSLLPSADTVARRGKLRGLGKELIRMDCRNCQKHFVGRRGQAPRYHCAFGFRAFVQAADPGLHDTLKWYSDAALVEAHGEQLLDLYIRLASEPDWKEWVRDAVGVAAVAGDPQVFHRLLDVGQSASELCPQETNSAHAHALLCSAAKGGSADIFSFLVADDGFLALARVGRPGCSEEQQKEWDRRLLDSAALGGSVAILPALLDIDDSFLALVDMRDDVDDTDDGYGSLPISPLHWAAQRGHARFAAALIDAGAPLEYTYKIQGMKAGTALEAAVYAGHEEVVLELLSAGADINTRDSYVYLDKPLLTIAIDKNYQGVVDVLLAAGADLGEDRAESLPLHEAAKRGYCGPLEKLLLAGANPNWVDSTGRSALHLACSHSHEDAVEVLLRHNASYNSLCDEGLSPHDVVAVEILKRVEQQRQLRSSRSQFHPSTLDAEQTLAADSICGMLRRASGWGRRGWLVLLRARRQDVTKAIDMSSLTLLSSTKPLREDQATAQGGGSASEDADAYPTLATWSVEAAAAAAAGVSLKHTVPAGGPGHETRESLATSATVDGGDENGEQARGSGWQGAVEWLTQCPDERGVFREVLSFV